MFSCQLKNIDCIVKADDYEITPDVKFRNVDE